MKIQKYVLVSGAVTACALVGQLLLGALLDMLDSGSCTWSVSPVRCGAAIRVYGLGIVVLGSAYAGVLTAERVRARGRILVAGIVALVVNGVVWMIISA